MQQIAEWLERLGMSEHAQRFAEHGIGIAALPHLTDQDLKDIGVLLGHRRIMLAAIAELANRRDPQGHARVSGAVKQFDGQRCFAQGYFRAWRSEIQRMCKET